MSEGRWDLIVAFIAAAIYLLFQIERTIRSEGEKTRQLLRRLFAETDVLDLASRDPTVGDRIKWIQWRINPRPD